MAHSNTLEISYASQIDGSNFSSGSIPPNPAELLASDNMTKLLDELSEIYDYIILDTPPVTVVTDAASLSQKVSGFMVVVREGYTNHESIEQALKLLKIAHSKILGFFVNDVDVSGMNYGSYRGSYARSYGKKYGYGYGYGYGYEYSDRNNAQVKQKEKSKPSLMGVFGKRKSDETKTDTQSKQDDAPSINKTQKSASESKNAEDNTEAE